MHFLWMKWQKASIPSKSKCQSKMVRSSNSKTQLLQLQNWWSQTFGFKTRVERKTPGGTVSNKLHNHEDKIIEVASQEVDKMSWLDRTEEYDDGVKYCSEI